MGSNSRSCFPIANELETDQPLDCAETFGYGDFQKDVPIVWVTRTHALAFSCVAGDLDHWCKQPADVNVLVETWKSLAIPLEANCRRKLCAVCTSPYDPNDSMVVRCEQWGYDAEVANNAIVISWDLAYHRRWLLAVVFIVFLDGSLSSLVVGGAVTDIIGHRKLSTLQSRTVLMLASFCWCFTSTYRIHLSTRAMISGLCTLCVVACSLVFEVSTNWHQELQVNSCAGIADLHWPARCGRVLRAVPAISISQQTLDALNISWYRRRFLALYVAAADRMDKVAIATTVFILVERETKCLKKGQKLQPVNPQS
ncbi:hypothetical protein V5799_010911 [Amblyomma americanum]|uniref:Uncharacterized protein n=1 Tax=Amblyomma americanum TaxID=6943 RepID=A0AAQ4EIN4_AMBAM